MAEKQHKNYKYKNVNDNPGEDGQVEVLKGSSSSMGCVAKCFQILLVVINIVFMLIGLGFIALGVFIQVGTGWIEPLVNKTMSTIPQLPITFNLTDITAAEELRLDLSVYLGSSAIGILILGGFIFILGMVGCFGVCCSSKCLLIVYVAILAILFIGQLIVAVLLFLGIWDPMLKAMAKDHIENKYGGIDSYDRESVFYNFLMIEFKCCGVYNYTDFHASTSWKKTRTLEVNGVNMTRDLMTPIACCKMVGSFPDTEPVNDTECAFQPTQQNSNYDKGCYDAVLERYMANEVQVIAIGSAILAVQLLLIVISVVVCLSISRAKKKKVPTATLR